MRIRRLDVVAILILAALAFGVRVAYLGQPSEGPAGHVFDERYFADAACRDISGQDYLDPEPPLGKLLIAAGIEVGSLWLRYPQQPDPNGGQPCRPQPSGYGTLGWRLANLAFGTALVPLLYLLALALWANRLFASLAGLLMTLDGLELVQSRLALLDIFPVFFAVLSVLLLQLHRRAATKRAWLLLGLALGLTLGLGAASKWTALSAWALVVLVLAGGWVFGRISLSAGAGSWRAGGSRPANLVGPAHSVDRLLFYAIVLVAVPLAVYVLSYARYLAVPHLVPVAQPGSCDFSRFAPVTPSLDPGAWLREVFMHDRWAYAYHLCQVRIDPKGSPWFSWPLLLHPSLYYQTVGSGGVVQVMWNLGNPLLWWAVIPALIYCGVAGVRNQRFAPLVIVAGYLCAWLPFSLIPRGLYLYHMLGALPYMVLALAFGLTQLVPARLELSAGPLRTSFRGSRLVVAYVVLVFAAFIFFYPLWTGMPISVQAYQERIWLNLPQLRVDWR